MTSRRDIFVVMNIAEKNPKKHKALANTLLIVMIIVQLGVFVYYMAFEKVGYHMDELWSYGLSNSYYHPHLCERDGVDTWDEYNKWQDEDFFEEYLTVASDERFDYDSVYYNQEQDVHPPLYYYILHTICSFFPNSFSPWYAFAINAVAFVVAQIFLYLCVKLISKSDFLSLLVCALWGFSTGAITCHIYLRMYALLIAFTLAYTYFNLKMLYQGFLAKRLAVLCVITYLGSLVQYFFIVYAGVMAACLCIYYLIKKKRKQLFAYGGFLLLSVGLAVLSFTPMISHMLAKNDVMGLDATSSQHETFALQMHFILRYMLDEISGISIHLIDSPIEAYILCAVLVLAAIGLPLCFLFRNEEWFKRFVSRIKSTAVSMVRFVRSKIGFSVAVLLILAISISSIFVINAIVSPIARMKESSSHYSVQVYPLFAAVVMCFVYLFIRSLPKKLSKARAPIVLAMCIGCVLGSRLDCDVNYLFNYNYEGSIHTKIGELSEKSNIILFIDGGSSIQIYPDELYRAEAVFISTVSEYEDYVAEYDKAGVDGSDVYLALQEEAMLKYVYADENKTVFENLPDPDGGFDNVEQALEVLVNMPNDNKIIDFIKESTKFDDVEFIGMRIVYGRTHYIYRLS